MAYLGSYWDGSRWGSDQDETTDAFSGRLSFRTQTTVTAASDQILAYAQQADETTSGAWSAFDTQIQFGRQTNTTAGSDTTTWDLGQIATDRFTTRCWNMTTNGFSEIGKLKNALMKIFEKVPKDLIKTKEDKKLVKAKEKSEKLLKDWLSPAEYEGLKNKGEIEIPSLEDEDVIFIVKRDPNQMVDIKKKGIYSHKLCAVAEDLDYPVGDQLLSKIALIKTNEKQFKEIAIRHG